MIGRTVSHYRIVSKLGEGGMGVVYKAEDLRLKRFVALKFLHPSLGGGEAAERFVHEAQAASALEHPAICAIYEIDATPEGHLYIAMPCYEGESLQAKIARGRLPVEEAVGVAVQVASGLAKAHEKGIVHRDVKPANVMVTTDGLVKILDFGLAKFATQSKMTRTGTTLGTTRYMSPEQARGEEVDARSDVWSLGAMLYEMLVGETPFRGEYDQAVIYAILNEEPKLVTAIRRDVPPELEDVIAKALSKKVEERYQSAAEMLADLEAVQQELTLGPEGKVGRKISKAARRRARRRLLLRVGLPAAVVILVGGFYLLRPVLFGEAISAPAPIAVIAFENQTGDSTLDYLSEAIPNLLITSLEQSKHLRVATWQRLGDLLKQVGKEGMEVKAVDRDLGLRVCSQGNINTIVWGSFTKAGDVFVTDAKVIDVRTKESVGSASARGAGIGSILSEQIDDLSARISKTVGAAPLLAVSSARPVTEIATTSMEAYNWYLKGYGALTVSEAESYFKKALAIDSTMAMAYMRLADVYFGRDWAKCMEACRQAKKYVGNANGKDRFLIESTYEFMVTADFDKGNKILIELVKQYPNEKEAHLDLADYYMYEEEFGKALTELEAAFTLDPFFERTLGGFVGAYSQLENFEKANDYAMQMLALAPEDYGVYGTLGGLYFKWGKYDEAIQSYAKAMEIEPRYNAEASLAYIRAFKEEYDACFVLIERAYAKAKRYSKYSVLHDKGFYQAVCGKTNESLSNIAALRSCADSLKGNLGLSGVLYAEAAVRYLRGEYDLSRQALEQEDVHGRRRWLQGENKREISYLYGVPHRNGMLSLIDLREGNTRSIRESMRNAREVLLRIDKLGVAGDYGMLTAVTANVCGFLEAEVQLAEGNPDAAIRTALATPPVGRGTCMISGIFNFMYNTPPIERDVAARAYVKKGDIDRAIAEYEYLVSTAPEKKDRLLILPIYHYRLAKLYEQRGRSKLAAEQYGAFLRITKGADIWLGEIADARDRFTSLSKTNR